MVAVVLVVLLEDLVDVELPFLLQGLVLVVLEIQYREQQHQLQYKEILVELVHLCFLIKPQVVVVLVAQEVLVELVQVLVEMEYNYLQHSKIQHLSHHHLLVVVD